MSNTSYNNEFECENANIYLLYNTCNVLRDLKIFICKKSLKKSCIYRNAVKQQFCEVADKGK